MFSTRSLTVVGIAGVLVCVATMLVVSWLPLRSSQLPVQAEGAIQSLPPSPTDSPPIVTSEAAPAWVGRRQATWAGDGSKTIAFELEASSDVPVWMTRARPHLVVRCLSRHTEVFVALGSAASIEPQASSHTVRVQIDDDPELLQRWSESVSSQELFAPDGLVLARRLARAHRLRFGFTPYNSRPVVADFLVQGFDQLAGLVANTCGWRLDERRASTIRPAHLK